jgi:hypothetical protein
MTPLRRRMLEDMQLRNFASETQRNYIHHIKGLAGFYQTSPENLDVEDVREYQLHLLNERQQSPHTVNQFVSAVSFLYHVTLETVWPEKALPRARVPHRPWSIPVDTTVRRIIPERWYPPIRSLEESCANDGIHQSFLWCSARRKWMPSSILWEPCAIGPR